MPQWPLGMTRWNGVGNTSQSGLGADNNIKLAAARSGIRWQRPNSTVYLTRIQAERVKTRTARKGKPRRHRVMAATPMKCNAERGKLSDVCFEIWKHFA